MRLGHRGRPSRLKLTILGTASEFVNTYVDYRAIRPWRDRLNGIDHLNGITIAIPERYYLSTLALTDR